MMKAMQMQHLHSLENVNACISDVYDLYFLQTDTAALKYTQKKVNTFYCLNSQIHTLYAPTFSAHV